jgi:hypothetical protein
MGECKRGKEMLMALKKRQALSEPMIMFRMTFCSIMSMIPFLKLKNYLVKYFGVA